MKMTLTSYFLTQYFNRNTKLQISDVIVYRESFKPVGMVNGTTAYEGTWVPSAETLHIYSCIYSRKPLCISTGRQQCDVILQRKLETFFTKH